jgi:hypothetical protein
MGMTPSQYYELFVEPNVTDYRDKPWSLRHAFNAIHPTSHMADHVWEYSHRHRVGFAYQLSLPDYLKHLAERTNNAFRDVRSIDIVFKHLYGKSMNADISSAGAIVSTNLASEGMQSDIAEVDDTSGRIIFTRKDGTTGDLLSVLNVVADYWPHEVFK